MGLGEGVIDASAKCIHNLIMVTYDKIKRQINLIKHEIDLADCETKRYSVKVRPNRRCPLSRRSGVMSGAL